jgi:hypothetical protein
MSFSALSLVIEALVLGLWVHGGLRCFAFLIAHESVLATEYRAQEPISSRSDRYSLVGHCRRPSRIALAVMAIEPSHPQHRCGLLCIPVVPCHR